jgi:hypothetical protein
MPLPWNHLLEPRLRVTATAGSSEPPLRAGTTFRDFTLASEGAGPRWLASPKSRKSLGLAATVCTSNSALKGRP